jgi:acetylornithine deacetylase
MEPTGGYSRRSAIKNKSNNQGSAMISDRPADLISLDMIRDLVAFNSVSRNSNLELVDFVHGYLESHGVSPQVIPSPDGQKANLFATIGPADKPGVILSGHTDVVPVDGEEWTGDPFTAVQRDGRLYGRGTTDMKGFDGIALAHVPAFLAADLQFPIHLALSYDEEVGCVGVRELIEWLNGQPVKPALCVVGEPTSMAVVTGHKGNMRKRCHVHGHEGHSSQAPLGVNAIEYAAELISFIKAIIRGFETDGARDAGYDIPFATGNIGLIDGGTALNIIARDCSFGIEMRYLSTEDPNAIFDKIMSYAADRLEPMMQAVDPNAGFLWQDISDTPGFDAPEDAAAIGLVGEWAQTDRRGKVAFGTEAGLFVKRGGIPAVVCGPGSIDQAHKPDEFIELEQIAACEAFMRRLIDSACAGPFPA